MDENPDETTPEVSFAAVADETPEESVAHEAEVTDEPVVDEDVADPDVHEDNAAPTEPTISSLLGGGPVAGGSELAP
jgi:hypothetical protein